VPKQIDDGRGKARLTSHYPRSSYVLLLPLAWRTEPESLTALRQHAGEPGRRTSLQHHLGTFFNRFTAPRQRVQASLGVVPVTNTTLAPSSNPITVGALQCTHRPVGKKKSGDIFPRLVEY